jgi:hypothetical protein
MPSFNLPARGEPDWSVKLNDTLSYLNDEQIKKYVKPVTGVPLSDLDSTVQGVLNDSASKSYVGDKIAPFKPTIIVEPTTDTSSVADGTVILRKGTAVSNDAEIAQYAGTTGTATRTALDGSYAQIDPITKALAQPLLDDLAKRFRVTLPSLGSTTDIGPTIQALIDAKVSTFDLIPNQTYYIDSTIYRDSTDPRFTLTINCNNAIINLGPNAGSMASEHRGDSSIRFVFFINTKRGAYNTTTKVVNTTEGNTATGSYVATTGPGFVMRDIDIRGNNQAIRVAHSNNATVEILGGKTSFMNGGASTRGYCDSNNLQFRVTNPVQSTPSLLTQSGNGDNLIIRGNADSRALIADLQNCRGALIMAPVGGGLKFVDCAAISVLGMHIEGDEHLRLLSSVQVTRSQVTLSGELWSPNTEKTFPGILVDDAGGSTDLTTDLLIENVISRNMYRTDSVVDERQNSDLHITSMKIGSRIRARGFMAATQIVSLNEIWRTSPLITSDVAAIQTALTDGAAHIATGNWDLIRRDGAWKVLPPTTPDLIAVRGVTSAPTVDAISSYSTVPGNVAGATYNYYFASIDESGVYGPRTAAQNVVVSAATTTVRAIVNVSRPGRLAVWRQKEGSPIDKYAVVGVNGSRMFLFDTGDNINKRAWQTTNIPERPGTTATGSVDKLLFNGKTITLT